MKISKEKLIECQKDVLALMRYFKYKNKRLYTVYYRQLLHINNLLSCL